MIFNIVIRRSLQAVIVIFGVTFISFGVIFLRGDPAGLIVSENATQEEIQEIRQRMGFDQPWVVQYVRYMSRAVRGDFGTSLFHRTDALKVVLDRLPATFELAFSALLISLFVAVPLGTLAAANHNSIWDKSSTVISMLGQAVPSFFLGVMLILLFGVEWGILPVSGRGGWQNLILPAFALSVVPMAQNTLMIRSSVLEVLGEDYIRTAQAKGLTRSQAIWQHGLRNALVPMITLVGLQISFLVGGAIVIETIFAWPGIGRLIYQSIGLKDFPLVQAAVTILAVMFVLINLVVDITYGYLDPRIRTVES